MTAEEVHTPMAQIEGELVIHRPIHEVFDLVADERNEPRSNPRICRAEKLSPGLSALGPGSGPRQEQENWGGLKRFLEAREELAPEAS
jgi:hypothetical protein